MFEGSSLTFNKSIFFTLYRKTAIINLLFFVNHRYWGDETIHTNFSNYSENPMRSTELYGLNSQINFMYSCFLGMGSMGSWDPFIFENGFRNP